MPLSSDMRNGAVVEKVKDKYFLKVRCLVVDQQPLANSRNEKESYNATDTFYDDSDFSKSNQSEFIRARSYPSSQSRVVHQLSQDISENCHCYKETVINESILSTLTPFVSYSFSRTKYEIFESDSFDKFYIDCLQDKGLPSYSVLSVRIPLENLSKKEIDSKMQTVNFNVPYPCFVYTKLMYALQFRMPSIYNRYFKTSDILGELVRSFFIEVQEEKRGVKDLQMYACILKLVLEYTERAHEAKVSESKMIEIAEKIVEDFKIGEAEYYLTDEDDLFYHG